MDGVESEAGDEGEKRKEPQERQLKNMDQETNKTEVANEDTRENLVEKTKELKAKKYIKKLSEVDFVTKKVSLDKVIRGRKSNMKRLMILKKEIKKEMVEGKVNENKIAMIKEIKENPFVQYNENNNNENKANDIIEVEMVPEEEKGDKVETKLDDKEKELNNIRELLAKKIKSKLRE